MVKFLWKTLTGRKSSRSRSRSRSNRRGWSILRWFTPGLTVMGVVAALLAVITGQVDLPSLDRFRGNEPPVYEDPIASTFGPGSSPDGTSPGLGGTGFGNAGSTVPMGEVAPVSLTLPGRGNSIKSNHSIRIATFNIQMFGTKKSSDAEIMSRLAKVFQLFDVVAVQEIRGDPAIPLNELLRAISAQGGRYQAIHGRPLGRTSQTECYGFVWDQTRIGLVPESQYVVDDGEGENDRLHREPMVASFQTRVAPVDSRFPFRFTLINVHTDPDEVHGNTPRNELNVLDDVYQNVRNYEYEVTGEEDFILLGDLNVDVGGLVELGQISNIRSLVGDQLTNTRRSKTYDHILIDQAVTTEYVRKAGVLDLESFLNINEAEAIRVSDHLPVWAEFSVYESPRYPAGQYQVGQNQSGMQSAAVPSDPIR